MVIISASQYTEFRYAAERFGETANSIYGFKTALNMGKGYIILHSGTVRNIIEKRISRIVEIYKPEEIIDTGICGSLCDKAEINSLVVSERAYLCADFGNIRVDEYLESDNPGREYGNKILKGSTVTVREPVMSNSLRDKLHNSTGALTCDMETFWIFQAAVKFRMKKQSVRIVSDLSDEKTSVEWKKDLPGKLDILYEYIINTFI